MNHFFLKLLYFTLYSSLITNIWSNDVIWVDTDRATIFEKFAIVIAHKQMKKTRLNGIKVICNTVPKTALGFLWPNRPKLVWSHNKAVDSFSFFVQTYKKLKRLIRFRNFFKIAKEMFIVGRRSFLGILASYGVSFSIFYNLYQFWIFRKQDPTYVIKNFHLVIPF